MKDHNHECGECRPPYFERNNYFYGKMLTARDFFAEQSYFNHKRWLINRMLHGRGVVCGLDLVPEEHALFVTPGLALDGCGREIVVCEPAEVCFDAVEKTEEPKPVQICLRYDECKTERVELKPITCGDDGEVEFNRIRESFKVVARDMQDLPDGHYHDWCLLMESKHELPEGAEQGDSDLPESEVPGPMTLQQYLCERMKAGCPEEGDPTCVVLGEAMVWWRRIDDAGQAAVEESEAGQASWHLVVGSVHPCRGRRLVYPNPLLYRLIDCFHGDLPHIVGVDGVDFGQESMPWQAFRKLMKAGLTVRFDQRMVPETLNDKTFRIAVITEDEDTGYQDRRFVPAEEVLYREDGELSATFKPAGFWFKDTFAGGSRLKRHGGDVEVIVRGSSVMGAGGKALDGDFIGGRFPTGNGVQGGDFFIGFSVSSQKEESAA